MLLVTYNLIPSAPHEAEIQEWLSTDNTSGCIVDNVFRRVYQIIVDSIEGGTSDEQITDGYVNIFQELKKLIGMEYDVCSYVKDKESGKLGMVTRSTKSKKRRVFPSLVKMLMLKNVSYCQMNLL